MFLLAHHYFILSVQTSEHTHTTNEHTNKFIFRVLLSHRAHATSNTTRSENIFRNSCRFLSAVRIFQIKWYNKNKHAIICVIVMMMARRCDAECECDGHNVWHIINITNTKMENSHRKIPCSCCSIRATRNDCKQIKKIDVETENMLGVRRKLVSVGINGRVLCAFAILVPKITVNNINTTETDTDTEIWFASSPTRVRYYYYIFMYRYGCPFVYPFRNGSTKIAHSFSIAVDGREQNFP